MATVGEINFARTQVTRTNVSKEVKAKLCAQYKEYPGFKLACNEYKAGR